MAQVVAYKIDAPKKNDHISARDFCEKTFVPTYRKYRNDNPATIKVKMEVCTDKTTEQTLYFVEVNKILREICPELITSYTIMRRK